MPLFINQYFKIYYTHTHTDFSGLFWHQEYFPALKCLKTVLWCNTHDMFLNGLPATQKNSFCPLNLQFISIYRQGWMVSILAIILVCVITRKAIVHFSLMTIKLHILATFQSSSCYSHLILDFSNKILTKIRPISSKSPILRMVSLVSYIVSMAVRMTRRSG